MPFPDSFTAEEEDLDEYAMRAFNPDGMITVTLPSGGWATVAPDVSLETLMALDRMVQAAAAQFGAPASIGGAS